MFGYRFYVDPSRCIGCRSCITACAECDSHRGVSMIHVDYIDRPDMIGTVPMVCMHCEEPTCALVCPADAIKRGEDGVVRSALKTAMHRLFQLCPRVPVRRSQSTRRH
jgi:Fe-S-cluster-containing dehydrogenase component